MDHELIPDIAKEMDLGEGDVFVYRDMALDAVPVEDDLRHATPWRAGPRQRPESGAWLRRGLMVAVSCGGFQAGLAQFSPRQCSLNGSFGLMRSPVKCGKRHFEGGLGVDCEVITTADQLP